MKRLSFLLPLVFPILTWCQCFDGDCVSGKGSFKFKNGVYVGEFFAGQPDGQGTFSTNKGYSYKGGWIGGLKSGKGVEKTKKNITYDGEFRDNIKNGSGTGWLSETKHMFNVIYSGEWSQGSICGKGEMKYSREVKYNRERVVEFNTLTGDFINGVYQGRLTSNYSDELNWEPFGLEMTDFQKYEKLTKKERSKRKNPATIEGDIVVSCECLANTLVFDSYAILRKEMSTWSTEDIPTKTKQIVLNSMQREFDIIQWHANVLEIKLNKAKLVCERASLDFVWTELSGVKKQCNQVRKSYLSETAWNPNKGRPKNTRVQQKWDNQISKKLETQQKKGGKIESNLRKKLTKKDETACLEAVIDISFSPISKAIQANEKKEVGEPKKIKKKKILTPQFPRSKQLE